MDNKEAIKELSEWLDGCCGGEEIEPTRQALRLAISALQAQYSPKPTAESVQNVQNEDLILRKAAIDALKDWYDGMIISSFRGIEKVIKALPSAQPEIIRCKDCRWRKDQSGSTAWLPCRAIVTPSDFYCGRAERRTDEPDK